MQVKKIQDAQVPNAKGQSLHIIYANTAYTKATLDSYDIQ